MINRYKRKHRGINKLAPLVGNLAPCCVPGQDIEDALDQRLDQESTLK